MHVPRGYVQRFHLRVSERADLAEVHHLNCSTGDCNSCGGGERLVETPSGVPTSAASATTSQVFDGDIHPGHLITVTSFTPVARSSPHIVAASLPRHDVTPMQLGFDAPICADLKACYDVTEHQDIAVNLEGKKLALVDSMLRVEGHTITGKVKVCEEEGDKKVWIRWSDDGWCHVQETECVPVGRDIFSFSFTAVPGRRVELAAGCLYGSSEYYWDNNSNQNFVVHTC